MTDNLPAHRALGFGGRFFHARAVDPEGNRFEIWEPAPEAMAQA